MTGFIETTADGDAITKTAREIDQKISEMKHAFNRIYGYISDLNTCWQGPASEQFSAIFQSDKSVFAQYLADCADLNTKLISAGTQYSNAEESAEAAVRHSDAGGGGGW